MRRDGTVKSLKHVLLPRAGGARVLGEVGGAPLRFVRGQRRAREAVGTRAVGELELRASPAVADVDAVLGRIAACRHVAP